MSPGRAVWYPLASVARVLGVSRQALSRTPKPRTVPKRRPIRDPIERVVVEEALDNQTGGYRMVCAFVRRRLGVAVNPKRVLRVMREHNLIQRRRRLERRKRPGFFRVERPRRLWQLDIDQYLGRRARLDVPDGDHRLLHPRARRVASIGALPRRGGDHARRGGGPAAHRIQEGELTLGSDNGSAFTARRFKARLRNPRPGPPWYRRLRRALPPPPPLGARLPDSPRGAPEMGRSTTTTKTGRLTRQHRQGGRQKGVPPPLGPRTRAGPRFATPIHFDATFGLVPGHRGCCRIARR